MHLRLVTRQAQLDGRQDETVELARARCDDKFDSITPLVHVDSFMPNLFLRVARSATTESCDRSTIDVTIYSIFTLWAGIHSCYSI